MPEKVVEGLHKSLRLLMALTYVNLVVMLCTVGYVYHTLDSGIGKQADRLTTALCNQRDDQIERVRSSTAFLKAHPHGAFGFTRAQLQDGINRSKKNIAALEPLDCG